MRYPFRSFVLLSPAIVALLLLGSCGHRARPIVDLQQKEDPRMAKAFDPGEARFCSFEVTGLGKADASGKASGPIVQVTVIGTSKADLQTNLNATCAKLDAGSKGHCEAVANSDKYPCVAPSLLRDDAATPGVWTCSLPFTANDVDEKIVAEKHATAAAALGAIFKACAELTDDGKTPDPASANDLVNGEFASGDASSSAATIDITPSLLVAPSPTPAPSASPAPAPSPTATPTTYTTPSKRRDACAAALLAEKATCTNANDYPVITPSPKPPRRLHH